MSGHACGWMLEGNELNHRYIPSVGGALKWAWVEKFIVVIADRASFLDFETVFVFYGKGCVL